MNHAVLKAAAIIKEQTGTTSMSSMVAAVMVMTLYQEQKPLATYSTWDIISELSKRKLDESLIWAMKELWEKTAWCLENFGADESRWWRCDTEFEFRDEADRMLFVLRWRGENTDV